MEYSEQSSGEYRCGDLLSKCLERLQATLACLDASDMRHATCHTGNIACMKRRRRRRMRKGRRRRRSEVTQDSRMIR